VRVKGKSEPVSIYEPLGNKGGIMADTLGELDDYHACLKLYRTRKWDQAAAGFARLAGLGPACRLYQLYLERSRHFQKQPPDKGWDGSCTYTRK